jgi:hypothetical protein
MEAHFSHYVDYISEIDLKRALVACEGFAAKPLCGELVSVVKYSTLANQEEGSLRFFIRFYC